MSFPYRHRKFPSSAGFTMIEILVVIMIIGVLAAIGIGGFMSSQQKSRDARRKSDLQQISKALELYFNDRREYPAHSKSGSIEGCTSFDSPSTCEWGDDFSVGETLYMVDLPADPSGVNYYYESTGTSFELYARLENNLDKDVPKIGTNDDPGVYEGTQCGDLVCNYRVASPNAGSATVIAE